MQNMKEEFNKETEIQKKNRTEILEIKSSKNLIKKFRWKPHQQTKSSERLSGLADKVDEPAYSDSNKEKKWETYWDIQELWNNFKWPRLWLTQD